MKPQATPAPAPAPQAVAEDESFDFDLSGLPSTSMDQVLSASAAKEAVRPAAPAPVVPQDGTPPPAPGDAPDFKDFQPTDEDGNIDPSATPPAGREKPKGKANDALREQMKKINEEKEAALAEINRIKAEKEASEKERDDFRQKLEDEGKARAELQGRLTQRDPRNAPQVKALTEEWNRKLSDMSVIMAEHDMDTTGLQEFMAKAVADYSAAGNPQEEGFREKASAVRQRVARVFGDLSEKGMDLVRSGAVTMRQVQAVMKDIQTNAPKYEHEERSQAFQKEAQAYLQEEAGLFTASDELRDSDPLNAKVILSAMVNGSDEVKTRAEQAKKLTRFALLPLAPVDPALLEGKNEQQRREFIGARVAKHRDAYRKVRAVMPEALVALQLLPGLWDRVQKMERQLKLGRNVVPKPKLNGTNASVETVEEGPIDIKDFKPENAMEKEIFVQR